MFGDAFSFACGGCCRRGIVDARWRFGVWNLFIGNLHTVAGGTRNRRRFVDFGVLRRIRAGSRASFVLSLICGGSGLFGGIVVPEKNWEKGAGTLYAVFRRRICTDSSLADQLPVIHEKGAALVNAAWETHMENKTCKCSLGEEEAHMENKSGKRKRKREENASMTVEASLVFPILFAIVFLLVRMTFTEYKAVQEKSRMLYEDTVTNEAGISTMQIIRITDTAFQAIE